MLFAYIALTRNWAGAGWTRAVQGNNTLHSFIIAIIFIHLFKADAKKYNTCNLEYVYENKSIS